MSSKSLLEYYQQNSFNPVPIPLEDRAAWELHFAKRHNLYERHLGIPFSLLPNCSVLEFGCNSGENALVLACVGANLTLVEPNDQVLPQLKALFQKFGVTERIAALVPEGIDTFESDKIYDIVLAEGFLFTLPNRDAMVQKICRMLKPGGLAVISFNDRYGCLLEMTRRMVLWRAYQIQGIGNVHSQASLYLAEKLYGEDFSQLKASRSFEAWWKDTLINPFLASAYHWSYPELIPLMEKSGCEFYASSPKWTSIDRFTWYKNVLDSSMRHQQLIESFRLNFAFLLTGLEPLTEEVLPASFAVIDAVANLIERLSDFTVNRGIPIESVVYPSLLDEYLNQSQDSRLVQFNLEMKSIYDAAKSSQLEQLISAYHESKCVRSMWGAPYHYICFSKVAYS
jgi:SAM-dependent methyltransferase